MGDLPQAVVVDRGELSQEQAPEGGHFGLNLSLGVSVVHVMRSAIEVWGSSLTLASPASPPTQDT